MTTKGQVTEAKIARFIRGCESAGKTVRRVIVEGNRVEVITAEDQGTEEHTEFDLIDFRRKK